MSVTKKVDYDQLVHKVSLLANLPYKKEMSADLETAFEKTIEVINTLNKADVSQVTATTRVSAENNRWREDKVLDEYMLTQKQALANASRVHDGYFVVDRLIDDGS